MKNKLFLALATVLMFCLMAVQPVFAVGRPAGWKGPPHLQGEYKIEFEAEAEGVFFVLEGFIGPGPFPPPVVAVGEGMCKLDGDAAVDNVIDNIYGDFPAQMKMDGEIKGQISPAEFVDGDLVIYEEAWRIELEFWNLDNAGGIFWPDAGTFMVSYDLPEGEVALCMGYKLELERLDAEEDDEELKMSGEAYGVAAGVFLMDGWYEAFIFLLDVAGDPYSLVFAEPAIFPEIESEVEVEVEPDID